MADPLGVRRKYRLRRVLFSTPVTIATVLLALVLFHAAYAMYERKNDAEQKSQVAKQELKQLQSRESELRSEISRLSTPRGVEEELRKRFMVSKNGEEVAIIVGEGTGEAAAIAPVVSKSFLQRFLSAVGFSN